MASRDVPSFKTRIPACLRFDFVCPRVGSGCRDVRVLARFVAGPRQKNPSRITRVSRMRSRLLLNDDIPYQKRLDKYLI